MYTRKTFVTSAMCSELDDEKQILTQFWAVLKLFCCTIIEIVNLLHSSKGQQASWSSQGLLKTILNFVAMLTFDLTSSVDQSGMEHKKRAFGEFHQILRKWSRVTLCVYGSAVGFSWYDVMHLYDGDAYKLIWGRVEGAYAHTAHVYMHVTWMVLGNFQYWGAYYLGIW